MPLVMLQPSSLLLLLGIEQLRVLVPLLGHQNQLDRLARTLQLARPVLELRVHLGGKLALSYP